MKRETGVWSGEAFFYRRCKSRVKGDLWPTAVWEEQRQPLGSAGISPYLEKSRPPFSGRNVSGTIPWGPLWGVKDSWTLCHELLFSHHQKSYHVDDRPDSLWETTACHAETPSCPWGSQWSHCLVSQVLCIEPALSSVENRWLLVQRCFQDPVGKPRTWKKIRQSVNLGASLSSRGTSQLMLPSNPNPSLSPIFLTVQAKLCMVFIN